MFIFIFVVFLFLFAFYTYSEGIRDNADAGLRDLLLRIAAFGLYAYSLFGVIAGAMQLHNTQHLFVLVTNVLTIVQVLAPSPPYLSRPYLINQSINIIVHFFSLGHTTDTVHL